MKSYEPSVKIAVRDNLEEEMSDDIEDDVFIRDGRFMKGHEENGLKRPLMAPRRKTSKYSNSVSTILKNKRKCWKCCEPFCYAFIVITIVFALTFLAAVIFTMFPIPLQKIKIWLRKDTTFISSGGSSSENLFNKDEMVPCSQINVQKIWSKAFSKLTSESSIQKSLINNDKIEDIIIGYGIDDNYQYEDESIPKCNIDVSGEIMKCEGGILAIDGSSGATIWQRWTSFNVFSLYCLDDFNGDRRNDCVAAGRGGLIIAINGQNGNILWQLRDEIEISNIIMDLYTVNRIHDIDDDDVSDILAVHVEERESSRAGHIKLISGRTGKIIRVIPTPNLQEVFVPLQIITQSDGTENLLIITGGQNTPGGVYQIRLHSLMQYINEGDFSTIYQNFDSGFMVPAIFTDLNADSIEDIIVASFNSTVYAFDGKTYEIIWNFTIPLSESVSSIVPGHFNNDNVTDIMIKYNTGPGFPVYYYSQTTILNGIDGQPLLDQMMLDAGGSNSLLGGVSVSQTFGGDFYLHWQTQCRDKYEVKDGYQFLPDSDVIQQARADTCMLRYNSSTVLKLYAISRNIEPPGAVIFSTDDLVLQLNQTINQQQSKQKSPLKHPKMLKKILNKEINPLNTMSNSDSNGIEYSSSSVDDSNKSVTDIDKKNLDLSPRNSQIDQNLELKPNNNKQPMNILNDRMLLSSQQQRQQQLTEDAIKNYMYNPYAKDTGSSSSSSSAAVVEDNKSDLGNLEEYENYFNEEPNRKISIRTKYPTNRDIRSKTELISDPIDYNMYIDENATHPDESETRKKTLADDLTYFGRNHPETLWDLELEKEESETINEAKRFDYAPRIIRQDDVNKNILPSISSPGVIVQSLEDTPSTIDFVFVLNVRESELYPPLLLADDVACLEDKLSGYRSFTNEDLLLLEKQFLKQCLKNRLANLTPHRGQFESQIVMTRISITCSCGILENGEICSKLNTIDNQKWTGFMGNNGNGLYPQ